MRSYRAGDQARIFELWKAVFPESQIDREKWLRWWQWTYEKNPAGQSWVCLAEDNGKIVGQVVNLPVLMKIGDQTMVVFLARDSMTHPGYRGQGIYYNLALRNYAAASEDKVNIGIGFPNNNMYPIDIKKLNLIGMHGLRPMIKVFNWKNVLKLRKLNNIVQSILSTGASLTFNGLIWRTQKAPAIEGLSIISITFFNDQFDELWTRVFNQSQIMVVRNKDYLNWRYGCPDRNYSIFAAKKEQQILGYIVLDHKIQENVKISIILT